MSQNQIVYSNIQERWVNGKGQRNSVTIKRRGTATKTVQELGPGGRIRKSKTRKLTCKERANILKGIFVPGLWKNCCIKSRKE